MANGTGEVNLKFTKSGPPRPMLLAFGLYVLTGLVGSALFAISVLTRDWTAYNAVMAGDLASKPNRATDPFANIPGFTVYVLASAFVIVLPVLLGWSILRGRSRARNALTGSIALSLLLVAGAPPHWYVLTAINIGATVLIWLPSSTAFIASEGQRRKQAKGGPDAKIVVPPGGRSQL